ncbi:YkgJ family cysteine cluster protein, partial [Nostoc sp. CHAB 5834]|nr:YkgJ family cysteine cluster protein [Nostoc sp. CHAB 5834]
RLRYLASELSDAFTGVSACSTKCSHCCHIDVHVPKVEAKLIAKATGRKLNRELEAKPMLEWSERKSFKGSPCTFLNDGMCSIYAHRPLVCRTLINMDDVSVLCELVPDVPVPVPYLNTMSLQEAFSLLTQNEPVADIREWFPAV